MNKETKKEYKYYVSYATMRDGNLGFACDTITNSKPVLTREDIENTMIQFKESRHLDKVIIICFKEID